MNSNEDPPPSNISSIRKSFRDLRNVVSSDRGPFQALGWIVTANNVRENGGSREHSLHILGVLAFLAPSLPRKND